MVKASVVRGQASGQPTLSQRIDRIVTGKYTALPLFLCAMLVMFVITFGPFGSWLQDGVSALIDLFSGFLRDTMTAGNVSPVLISLVCDGIIAGVGGVLSFLPQIALLFFFLSFLEDSGYMSRAAFIMDRLLRRFGLSGKAFIPMLMGFGCSVPAIMGARTMENEKDRRMTILLIPFMSCSAKLPVYGMIAGAFFGPWAGSGGLWPVCHRHVGRHSFRHLLQAHPLCRRTRSLRTGAAPLPPALYGKHRHPMCGRR